MNKKVTKGKVSNNEPEEANNVHIWLGTFNSKKELNKYAKTIEDSESHFFDDKMSLLDILYITPADSSLALHICKEKFPKLEKANSLLMVYGSSEKEEEFEKANLNNTNIFYIGNFDFAEEDTDSKYDAWI